MTFQHIPRYNVQFSANDVTSMWRKGGIHVLHGLQVTQTDTTITIGEGSAQLDGTSFTNTQDVVFNVPRFDGVVYVVFLISNRTNLPQTTWTPETITDSILIFPNNLSDYGGVKSIPPMSTRFAVAVIADRVTNIEPILLNHRNVNGLYSFPMWSVDNESNEYYYPSGYNLVYAMRNLTHYYGLGIGVDIPLTVFNSISMEGNLSRYANETNILQLGISISTIGTVEGNVEYNDIEIPLAGNLLNFPIEAHHLRCTYTLGFRKFERYLLIYGNYFWDNGDVHEMAGQLYTGDYNFGIGSVGHITSFAKTPMSDFRLRVS